MRTAVVAAILTVGIVHAQTPPVAFEVASVKRNTSGESRTYFQIPNAGTVNITNANVRALVRDAYEIDPSLEQYILVPPSDNPLISAGKTIPDLMSGPRFDVQARIPDDKPGQQRAMLRTLLADRFKLRVHRETRDLPVYALTVVREGRLGPSLRPSTTDCAAYVAQRRENPSLPLPQGADGRPLCSASSGFPAGGALTVRTAGQSAMLPRLLQPYVDRPIVDASGLKGSFEFTVSFGVQPNALESGQPTLFTALQEQLGLKLEAKTAPYEVLVIDSVEMPSEN
jgi:uncharacterized protein (TIGR03435 family)